MHVGLFLHSLSVGGAQRRSVMLANGLARLGHRIDLITVLPGAPLETLVDPAVRLVALSRGSGQEVAVGFRRTGEMAASVAGLVRHLRAEQPDMLVSMANHSTLPAVLAHRLAGRGDGRSLVLRASNHLSRRRGGQAGSMKRLPERWFWRQADGILAVSEDVGESVRALTGLPADRVHPVPSPILPEGFPALLRGPIPDLPFPATSDAPLLVAMGRFVRQKGFDSLLRGFAMLRERLPVRLALVGDGPDRDALRNLADRLGIADAVAWPGLLDNPFPLLAEADLFVLSSRWEGMPGVLVEALACGCPVVSTDCPGGSRELLKQGALGPLVPVDDVQALAAAMEAVLRQPPERSALREAAAAYETVRAVAAYERALLAIRRERSPSLLYRRVGVKTM